MAQQDNNSKITVYHTNDFHNGLTEPKARRIEEIYRNAIGDKLLFDAGDASGSGNITFRPAGEPIMERMSRIGYDAMTVGNRDFHVSQVGFRCKLSLAAFPILCANIRASKPVATTVAPHDAALPLWGERNPRVYSHRVFRRSQAWTVVVFGLTVPMITERMWERKLSAYIFDDPIRVAQRLAPELKARFSPDVMIALTHIGTRRDRELAANVPGIDLIISGHSHDVFPEGERVGNTLIVQTGSHARNLGIVEITRQHPAGIVMTARLESL